MAKHKLFQVSVDGEKELIALFSELPKSVTDQAIKAAGKKALQPVAAMAKSIVESQSTDEGDLANSIIVSPKLSKRQRSRYVEKGLSAVFAGPSGKGAAHGHLVEFGTRERFTKKGASRGVGPSEPFMRPAWDALQMRVLQTMREELWGTLKAAVRRLRKQAEKGTLSKSNTRFLTGGK